MALGASAHVLSPSAKGGQIFFEDFNSSSANYIAWYQYVDETDAGYLAYWSNVAVPGWDVGDNALLTRRITSWEDKAILLYEFNNPAPNGTTTPSISRTIGGLTAGAAYSLSFDHWASGPVGQFSGYELLISIGDTQTGLLRHPWWSAAGSGATETIQFTATGSSVYIAFTNPNREIWCSPIIDNVAINTVGTVPDSSRTIGLLALSLAGLIALRRALAK